MRTMGIFFVTDFVIFMILERSRTWNMISFKKWSCFKVFVWAVWGYNLGWDGTILEKKLQVWEFSITFKQLTLPLGRKLRSPKYAPSRPTCPVCFKSPCGALIISLRSFLRFEERVLSVRRKEELGRSLPR